MRNNPSPAACRNRASCGELTGSVTDISENGRDGRHDMRPTVVARLDEFRVGQQVVFITLAFHTNCEKKAK